MNIERIVKNVMKVNMNDSLVLTILFRTMQGITCTAVLVENDISGCGFLNHPILLANFCKYLEDSSCEHVDVALVAIFIQKVPMKGAFN